MQSCYVCAASLSSEESLNACPGCGTPMDALHHLTRVVGRKRFLFGRVQQTPDGKQNQEQAQEKAPKKAKSKPAAKSRPKPAKPAAEEALHRDFEEADASPNLDPAITNRDPVDLPPEPESLPIYLRGGAHLIDVIVCILLNLWIFKLILWFSPRNFSALVTFSLIPILFVMLCFTALYFYLFIGLLKRSLGQIIMEMFSGSEKNTPPTA